MKFSCKRDADFAARAKAVLERAGYISGEKLVDLPNCRV